MSDLKLFGQTIDPTAARSTGPNSPLGLAAQLAASQPGLSQNEFVDIFVEAGFGDFFELGYRTYLQLTSPTGGALPTSAEEVTSPQPEAPGRFQATRPGDLLGAAELRFGA